MTKHSIRDCLATIGDVDFEGCADIAEEFSRIKKAYYKNVLQSHPDKGGDAAVFREVQTAFEVLREMYNTHKVTSFALQQQQTADNYEATFREFGEMPTPSWEYYYTAAAEDVPLYRVENARSGRSKCKQKGKAKKCDDEAIIPQGAIRVGSLHEDTGSYTRWNHLECWRVPSKIWLGLPDPEQCQDTTLFEHALLSMNQVLFCGMDTLNKEDTQTLLAHIMDKENWARLVRKKPKKEGPGDVVEQQKAENKQIVPNGYHGDLKVFVPPRPGKDGAAPDALQGKRVVLTGVFPEVGGGAGLNLGKAKVKAIIESFGGRVTSSVSGKTDILIVGKDPGYAKVSKARERGNVQLITLKDLKEGLEGGCLEGMQPALAIGGFSSGYGNNSVALQQPAAARALMADLLNPKQLEDSKPPAKKKAPPSEVSVSDANNPATKTATLAPEKNAVVKAPSKKPSAAKRAPSAIEDSKEPVTKRNRTDDTESDPPVTKAKQVPKKKDAVAKVSMKMTTKKLPKAKHSSPIESHENRSNDLENQPPKAKAPLTKVEPAVATRRSARLRNKK